MKKYSNEFIYLVIISLISIFFVELRNKFYPQHSTYYFFIWNLFLAWVPYVLSILFVFINKKGFSKISSIILLPWLIFFPNTFYLISDLIHITRTYNDSIWYHIIMIFPFIWSGIMLGSASLNHIYSVFKNKLKFYEKTILFQSIIFLTAVGIYLGRIPRWNSWDLIHNYMSIFSDIKKIFFAKSNDPESIIFIAGFFIICNIVWYGISIFDNKNVIELD